MDEYLKSDGYSINIWKVKNVEVFQSSQEFVINRFLGDLKNRKKNLVISDGQSPTT